MTQKFKYVGAQSPVDIPSLGLVEVTRGTHVEVNDPAQAEGMHGSDSWEHIPVKRKPAKKAASKRAAKKVASAPPAEPVAPVAPADDSQEG